ncbi:MAG: hypothetical protein RL141_727 [Candidatus Parcubacteria bacterium]|jgi:hypothetical protein
MKKIALLVCMSLGLSLGACMEGEEGDGQESPPVDAEPEAPPTDDTACDPGESRACACPDGRSGAQECRADLFGFQTCECTGPIPGANEPEPNPEPTNQPEPTPPTDGDECELNADCPGQCTPRTAGGPKECLPCAGNHQCRTSGRTGWVCEDGVCEAPPTEPEPTTPVVEPESNPEPSVVEPEANPEPTVPGCDSNADCGTGVCHNQVCCECVPGSTDACTNGGSRICGTSGAWGGCSEPPGVCIPSTVRNCPEGGQQICGDNGAWGSCPVPPSDDDGLETVSLSFRCVAPSNVNPISVLYRAWIHGAAVVRRDWEPEVPECQWGISPQKPVELNQNEFMCTRPGVYKGETVSGGTDFKTPGAASDESVVKHIVRERTGSEVPAECLALSTEDARRQCARVMDSGWDCWAQWSGQPEFKIGMEHVFPPNQVCEKDAAGNDILSRCTVPYGAQLLLKAPSP